MKRYGHAVTLLSSGTEFGTAHRPSPCRFVGALHVFGPLSSDDAVFDKTKPLILHERQTMSSFSSGIPLLALLTTDNHARRLGIVALALAVMGNPPRVARCDCGCVWERMFLFNNALDKIGALDFPR